MGLIRYVLSLLATLFLVIVEINLAYLLIPYFIFLRQAEYEPRRAINFRCQFESPTCLVSRRAFSCPLKSTSHALPKSLANPLPSRVVRSVTGSGHARLRVIAILNTPSDQPRARPNGSGEFNAHEASDPIAARATRAQTLPSAL